MAIVRLIAIFLSLLLHASLGMAMLPHLEKEKTVEAFDLGDGMDVVMVEQGIATEGIAKGDAMETIETEEIVPIVQTPPPPPDAAKPPEEVLDVVASNDSSSEVEIQKIENPPPQDLKPKKIEEIKNEEPPPPELKQDKPETVKNEEPPPPQEVEIPTPEVVQAQQQQEQVAVVTQQSSGEERRGGDAKALGQYLGQINDQVQRNKINPRTRVAGVVVMKFTVGLDGALLSKEIATSSGSPTLDAAATAALDRAAPFPPIPPEVSSKPLAFTQPFRFIMR